MLKIEEQKDKANIESKVILPIEQCGEVHRVITFSNFYKRNFTSLEYEAPLKLRQKPNGPL
jgi:hypothetical protein